MCIKYQQAAAILHQGGVIAYPTEGVWGLGCDPNNGAALRRLLMLKQRDPAKGLILIAASMQQIAPWLEGLNPAQRERLNNSWPGPVTWLVPDAGIAHPLVRGKHSAVALRVSAHQPVVRLCQAFGGPIVSTSANLSGRQPPTWPWQLRHQFGDDLDYLLHDPLGGRDKPSTIRDLATGRVIRGA